MQFRWATAYRFIKHIPDLTLHGCAYWRREPQKTRSQVEPGNEKIRFLNQRKLIFLRLLHLTGIAQIKYPAASH